MSFFHFLANKILRQPVAPSIELLDALNYSPGVEIISATSLFNGGNFDLKGRPLDLRTFGAITTESEAEDCMTSSELKEAVDEDYRFFGIER